MAKYVDESGYFPKSIKKLGKEFEKNRPQVVSIDQIKNGDQKVSPKITQLTVRFSKQMNQDYRNFNFGSLGKENSIRIKNFTGFSADGKSFTIEIEPLLPNKRYQLTIGGGFRDKAGASLKPYVIDIATADR